MQWISPCSVRHPKKRKYVFILMFTQWYITMLNLYVFGEVCFHGRSFLPCFPVLVTQFNISFPCKINAGTVIAISFQYSGSSHLSMNCFDSSSFIPPPHPQPSSIQIQSNNYSESNRNTVMPQDYWSCVLSPALLLNSWQWHCDIRKIYLGFFFNCSSPTPIEPIHRKGVFFGGLDKWRSMDYRQDF